MDSLKKHLSFAYCASPLVDGLKNNKVIIVTPFGVITGSPMSKNEPEGPAKFHTELTIEYKKQYYDEHSLDPGQPLDGNDGYVVLKDVVLNTGTSTFNFKALNIFYDQIIAITLGTPE